MSEFQTSQAQVAEEERAMKTVKGPLAWFARNSVAANVLMILLVVGGLLNLRTIKQEVFPGFTLDFIMVQLVYPGASPEEVERGAILVVEEAVRGMDGVKDVNATAREGFGVVSISLKTGEDAQQRRSEIEAAVNRITSFPQNMERANIFLPAGRFEVISLVLHGEKSEHELRRAAEKIRDLAIADPRVSTVDFGSARNYEMSIEVSQENLRRYNLTLDQVAMAVRNSSIEMPGGSVKTKGGELLLRTTERRQSTREFEDIVLISAGDGTAVTIGDIAQVKDGFEEVDHSTKFDGENAIILRFFRVGEEKPLEVASVVKELVEGFRVREGMRAAGETEWSGDENDIAPLDANVIPAGIKVDTWNDMSNMYKQRMDLLSRNAIVGLILVILVLGLFLDVKLAFWVTLGIPISFIGAFVVFPIIDLSLNMLSLFAFIQVLGMVVDDAIVVGEAAYMRRQQGMSPMAAAIAGVREVAMPVCFAIITTIVMYIPMLTMPGVMGKFMRVIPMVVIPVLILSLIESLLILPAHLAHSKKSGRHGVFGWIGRKQQTFSALFERSVDRYYVPLVRRAIQRRYLTMSIAMAILVGSIGLLHGGRVRQIDMPEIDADVVVVGARLPYGTSLARAQKVEQEIISAANTIVENHGGKENLVVGSLSTVGSMPLAANNDVTGTSAYDKGAHLIEMAIYMVPSEKRSIHANEFTRLWREALKDTVGLETLSFSSAMGPGAGPAVYINLSHANYEILKQAAADMAIRLANFEGSYDINDGFTLGKEQLDFKLSPLARSLGVTEASLASQLRGAFFGAEAVRQQRGRDEVRTYVRLPKSERESEFNIEEFLIRTPTGGEIPLARAATVVRNKAFTQLSRYNGQRVLSVTAMVDPGVADPKGVSRDVKTTLLPELLKDYPGLSYSTAGAEKEMAEANEGLLTGFLMALLGVFALLAIAFRSYIQPILIMLAIPFGFVGALWGHFLLGHHFSMMSMMGVVALSGVVINDSLILIVAVNDNRQKGMSVLDAIATGAQRRFRPILLTSLTTFFGLMPMLLETEMQAQFLVPMAVSLGFGVMFATGITLLVIPVCYHILLDAKGGARQVGELMGFLESAQDKKRGAVTKLPE